MKTLWTREDLEKALSCKIESASIDARGVSIDTRTLHKGDIFVALKGPISDGHDHVDEAQKAGAACALVSAPLDHLDLPQIVVPDTFEALKHLAAFARTRTNAKVAAVTGSFGKTGSKEALKDLLARQGPTTASHSSFNNHWGVPLSLARLHAEDAFGIFEVGMNHPGEIAPLARLVRPHVALITTVDAMHMAHMGSVCTVALEKASIFEGVEEGGFAILNHDNPYFEDMAAKAREHSLEVLSFGTHPEAFTHLIVSKMTDTGLEIEARVDKTKCFFHVPVFQTHWAMNALGVLTTIHALGADVTQAARDFEHFVLPQGRGHQTKVHHPKGGTFTIIDESYNAGPASMRAALETLGVMKPGVHGKRIAVLAEMLELGDESEAEHAKLLPLLEKAGVTRVFTMGQGLERLAGDLASSTHAFHAKSNEDLEALTKAVLAEIAPGDIIMLKGSRGQRAYRGRLSYVVDALLALDSSHGHGKAV